MQRRGPVGEQLVYALNEQQPYTGWVKSMHLNGQVESIRTYKDGKKDGLEASWYENGQKASEVTYKDGERDGLETRWDVNGNVTSEVTYKDGEPVK
jgi:antitoxin component YwqK of YwqJK toxin-antitoxin module